MKKISFSFTKSKALPGKLKTESKADIQFIDCIESNSIKLKGGSTTVAEKELIIPVKNAKPIIKEDAKGDDNESSPIVSVSGVDSAATLEAIAVKEILEESLKKKEQESTSSVKVLPIITEPNVAAAEESTLEDYESVPVADFGMAMLRGMGWKPEKGIGKTGRIVEPTLPVVRPKGIGLGAEINKVPTTVPSDNTSEDLVLKKGAYVQIIAGSKKHMYGEVQSFDEDVGRVFIKTSLGSSNISVNENMIRVVSKSEYKKSSRVLNQSKYEEYKRREEDDSRRETISRSNASESKRLKKNDYKNTNGN